MDFGYILVLVIVFSVLFFLFSWWSMPPEGYFYTVSDVVDSLVNGKGKSFRFSYFCVVLGFGQRYFFAVSGGNLAERIANLEWATNTQNSLCFTAVVCALHVLYNQRASSAE